MDFPIGSLVTLVVFILISSGIVDLPDQRFKMLLFGLGGALLGSFLSIPLPAPRGLSITLNTGHVLIPLLVAMFLWVEANVEDKYRASVGTLAVGLTLYGISSLLDLEPGLFKYPILFSVPIIVLIALLTGKTMLAASLAVVSGCTLVSALRFLEIIFTQDFVVAIDLPGSLVWNTMSVGCLNVVLVIWIAERVENRYREFVQARNSVKETIPMVFEDAQVPMADNSTQTDSELINPEQ